MNAIMHKLVTAGWPESSVGNEPSDCCRLPANQGPIDRNVDTSPLRWRKHIGRRAVIARLDGCVCLNSVAGVRGRFLCNGRYCQKQQTFQSN